MQAGQCRSIHLPKLQPPLRRRRPCRARPLAAQAPHPLGRLQMWRKVRSSSPPTATRATLEDRKGLARASLDSLTSRSPAPCGAAKAPCRPLVQTRSAIRISRTCWHILIRCIRSSSPFSSAVADLTHSHAGDDLRCQVSLIVRGLPREGGGGRGGYLHRAYQASSWREGARVQSFSTLASLP